MMKKIISISIIGFLTFTIGYFLCNAHYSTTITKNEKVIDSIQNNIILNSKIVQREIDSLTVVSNTNSKGINFKEKIHGEFVLKNAKYAGFNFINSKIVSWTNEMDIAHPDTLKISWLDNATFFTQDMQRHNENCPPRIWIYQIISFDGNHLILNEVNTSWNIDSPNSRLEFNKIETF